jgi:transposase
MSGRPSAQVVQAVALLRESGGTMSAYAAAKAVGIALSTIYRSPLYKAYKAGQPSPTPTSKEPR